MQDVIHKENFKFIVDEGGRKRIKRKGQLKDSANILSFLKYLFLLKYLVEWFPRKTRLPFSGYFGSQRTWFVVALTEGCHWLNGEAKSRDINILQYMGQFHTTKNCPLPLMAFKRYSFKRKRCQ